MKAGKPTIALYCQEVNAAEWLKALSSFDVRSISSEESLCQALCDAAEQKIGFFIIDDLGATADTKLLTELRMFREKKDTGTGGMRIAFASSPDRKTPSYFFRVLVNLDVLDIAAPREGSSEAFDPIGETLKAIERPKTYGDVVDFVAGEIVNPRLINASQADELREKTRRQTRIAVAQIDTRRGGSTHTTLLLARTLRCLGYSVAVFLDSRSWKNLRRCYPRANCNLPNGLIVLADLDFYQNEGFARVNGYDFVVADFGCARWIDIKDGEQYAALEESFSSAQLGILTSVVSPYGDHAPFERVLKIWQKMGKLQNLGGVKFAFFGIPNAEVLANWQQAALRLNDNAELYEMPYLPNPLRYEPVGPGSSVLMELLAPVLRGKDR